MYTATDLWHHMQEMGLTSRDTVLIHTSMSAVGPVEGGADGLLDAFCGYLSDGLFLVPTHTWLSVNPEHPVYDVRSSQPCIGIVPSRAAVRSEGFRSLHPTHSIWGYGKNAASFLAGEEHAASPCPPGFCWDRLADIHAKILLIGVGHNRNTFLHSVDERAGLTDRLGEPFSVTIRDQAGQCHCGMIRGHRCSRVEDVAEYYVNFEKPFLRAGIQTFGMLGNAQVRILDAAAARELVLRVYAQADDDILLRHQDLPEAFYR